MKDPLYSVGEIFRWKFMISRTLKPYASKIAITRIIKSHKLPHTIVATPHGPSYRIRLSTIHRHNEQMRHNRALKSRQ